MERSAVNGLIWTIGIVSFFLIFLWSENRILFACPAEIGKEGKSSVRNHFVPRSGETILAFSTSTPDAQTQNAQPLKVYPGEDEVNRNVTFRDVRWSKLKTTDTPIAFPRMTSLQQWQHWAQDLRQRILIAAGLWPAPPKTALHAHIFGKIAHADYSVEKVYFESLPGFFVTGNLYRPRGKSGPFPAILTPHGHWKNGRLENSEKASVPARCIQFARMGAVVFSPDMVGYVDSRQISHHFASDRLSQVWGISLLGLQLWDNIRSLDFLESLSDVDTSRLGCTGASGGGTQTFLLTAVDPRVKVSAPVNMVSAHFQGGCLCENAPELRLDYASNVAFAALAAPRPLLLVSDTYDWTKNTPWVEYPMVRQIYRLYGMETHVKYVQFDFPHNYNKSSREAVYAWFAKWLMGKSDTQKVEERPFRVEPQKDLRVFPDGHPPGSLNARRLKVWWRDEVQRQLQASWPKDGAGWNHFQAIYGTAYRHVLAAQVPEQVASRKVGTEQIGEILVDKFLISRKEQLDWIPALYLHMGQTASGGILVISGKGKSVLFTTKSNHLKPWVVQLLKSGHSVLAIDPFSVGEHTLLSGMKTPRSQDVKFFTTYNRTNTQEQVQDVLTASAFLRKNLQNTPIFLLGLDQGGATALLASGLDKGFQQIVIDAQFLRTKKRDSILLQYFIPGLGRIGDFTAAAAMIAPRKLTLISPSVPSWFGAEKVAEVYKILDRKKAFNLIPHRINLTAVIKNWLK